MKKIVYLLLFFLISVSIISCNSNSLQSYIVKNSENKDFKSVNFSPKDFLKLGGSSVDEKNILNVIENVHILMYEKKNNGDFQKEYQEVKQLLKTDKYEELIQISNKEYKINVNYVGSDDNIKEVILLVSQNKEKFALMRMITQNLNIDELSKLSSDLTDIGNSVDHDKAHNVISEIRQLLY
ncbi:conserved exported hypothetical protein [Capnocytophaga canis]|uniref:DUF4252 domain-containing protein n=1 Tax=Capnocytophaga canis TaxID=1848903 RepID=UPI00058984E3|nr:DUF4252 domain-containing protein [Capnocytophaga canis]CEN42486.1 conserved exported hypothetical protein [Capnocytophaga canis]